MKINQRIIEPKHWWNIFIYWRHPKRPEYIYGTYD